jgi:hypothetical protein
MFTAPAEHPPGKPMPIFTNGDKHIKQPKKQALPSE